MTSLKEDQIPQILISYHLAYFLLFLLSISQRASHGVVLKRTLRLHAEALAVLEIYAEDDEGGDELRSRRKGP